MPLKTYATALSRSETCYALSMERIGGLLNGPQVVMGPLGQRQNNQKETQNYKKDKQNNATE